MSNAKYKITYNPYDHEVILEEYTNGNPPWERIGENSRNTALSNVVGKGKDLRQVSGDLLKALEDYESADHIQLCFSGSEKNYKVLSNKFNYYVKHSNQSKYEKEIQYSEIWASSGDVDKELGEICKKIKKEFSDVPEIQAEYDKLSEAEESKNALNIIVAGEQNVGKSTFINALIGQQLLPVSNDIETGCVCILKDTNETYIKFMNNDKEIVCFNCETQRVNGNPDKINDFWTIVKACKNQTECLREINRKCNNDYKGRELPFDEIIIGVKNLKVGDSDRSFIITDVPGAGAKGLKSRHDSMQNGVAHDAVNSVVVYIYSADAFSRETPQIFLEKLQETSDTNQIDWLNAVYVINRADNMTDKEFEQLRVAIKENNSFSYKNFLMTDAREAMYIKTKDKELKQSYIIKFTTSYNEALLYKQSIIPEDEKDEIFKIMEAKKGKNGSDTDLLVNTGIPLVEYLLDRYAAEAFEEHSVESYESRMSGALGILDNSIRTKSEDIENKKKYLEAKQKATKGKLQKGCNDIYDDWKKDFEKKNPKDSENKDKNKDEKTQTSEIARNICEKSRPMIRELSDSIPQKVEAFRKEAEELRREYKGKKQTPSFKVHEYLLEKLEKYINDFFKDKWPNLTKRAESLAEKEIEELQKTIAHHLDLRDLEEEERKEIKNKILSFKMTKSLEIDFDDMKKKSRKKIENATKSSDNPLKPLPFLGSGIALGILAIVMPVSIPAILASTASIICDVLGIKYVGNEKKENKKITKEIEEMLGNFYMHEMVPFFSGKVIDYIEDQGRELKKYCCDNIENLSLELIEEQKKIDDATKEKEALKSKKSNVERLINEKNKVMHRFEAEVK